MWILLKGFEIFWFLVEEFHCFLLRFKDSRAEETSDRRPIPWLLDHWFRLQWSQICPWLLLSAPQVDFYRNIWILYFYWFCAICFCFDFELKSVARFFLWNQLKLANFSKSDFPKLPISPDFLYGIEKVGANLKTR